MIKGTTKSGFDFAIPDGIANDYRLIKAYKKIRSANPDEQMAGAIGMVSVVLGNEAEEERLLAHLAAQNGGRVPVEAVYNEIAEILLFAQNTPELKN